jgi:hypothetical protein
MKLSIRTADAAVAVWAAVWVIAAGLVYTSVKSLEEIGTTVETASLGLGQTSRGLDRASAGLRDTGQAFDLVPVVGSGIARDIRRTAADVDQISGTVRRLALQARANADDAADSARTLAIVLGLAVLLVPTLPIVALYLILRPLVAQQLAAR